MTTYTAISPPSPDRADVAETAAFRRHLQSWPTDPSTPPQVSLLLAAAREVLTQAPEQPGLTLLALKLSLDAADHLGPPDATERRDGHHLAATLAESRTLWERLTDLPASQLSPRHNRLFITLVTSACYAVHCLATPATGWGPLGSGVSGSRRPVHEQAGRSRCPPSTC